jgi:hypothetical protein
MTYFVPAYPRIDATIRADKTGEFTINGTSRAIEASDLAKLRAGVIARCASTARQVHRPVRVHIVDVANTYAIAIHPDAFVQILDEDGNTADAPETGARTIGASPCRKCCTSISLAWPTCPECGVTNPHDVQTAPASDRLSHEGLVGTVEAPPVPTQADTSELLARWVPPANLLRPARDAPQNPTSPQSAAAVQELDDEASPTRLMPRRRPTPTLSFTNGQNLALDTSALVGRNPVLRDDEAVAQLFTVDDPSRTVSKTHFRIDWHDSRLMIIDLHSGNGIVVERGLDHPRTLVPMVSFELHDEDHVLIGDQTFTVAITTTTPAAPGNHS